MKFKFDTRKEILFENLSFEIKNKFVGLRGTSGTGKSTLVDILCGIRKPQIGEIKIDGIDIYSSINEWRKKVALVSQSTTLLDENLKKILLLEKMKNFWTLKN